MQSEILETFEHEGQTIFIRLEEDASDQDWLTVRPYYADGMLVNQFVYSVHKEERMKRLSEDEEDPVKELCAQCALISKVRRHKNSNSPAAGRVRLSINRSISISLLHAKSVSRREEVCGNIRQLSNILSKNGFK